MATVRFGCADECGREAVVVGGIPFETASKTLFTAMLCKECAVDYTIDSPVPLAEVGDEIMEDLVENFPGQIIT